MTMERIIKTNETMEKMKKMPRAMNSYVYLLWEVAYESDAQEILEIGGGQMQSGRTFLSALEQKKGGRLTTIDTKNRSGRLDTEEHLKPYHRMIVADSTLESTIGLVNDVIYDIILIDGSHIYEDVKKDYENYFPLLREGGLMFFHDICNKNCTVPKFWEELDIKNKISLNYGRAATQVIPGLGIIQK